jgi:S-adenosylmethionine:tRNA ribosyltransferase-isomerase
MKTSDFDYPFDENLIALEPLAERSASRLLCLNKNTGQITHKKFTDILDFINPNDLLVFNDTKVIPARLNGTKHSGGYMNMLIERVMSDTHALAQMKGANTPLIGTHVRLKDGTNFVIEGRDIPFFIVKLYDTDKNWNDIMNAVGEIPLPPYIERQAEAADIDRYQTVYAHADKAASVAAPTAGLHFDDALLQHLKAKGVNTAHVTLHVGAGTFQPLRTEGDEDPRTHQMHSERIEITQETCDAIAQTRKKGGRIIAVGTTSVRCLETAQGKPYTGETDIFITPGYQFEYVDALITNFHLPKTTLLMLVSAFAGRENVMNAYNEATEKKYRFFSYGDAMYINGN